MEEISLTGAQRIALRLLGVCPFVGAIARIEHDVAVTWVAAAIWAAALAVVLWACRGYDWRGRPVSSVLGQTSVAFRVLLGLLALVALVLLVRADHSPPAPRVPAPLIELGVIPRSLHAGALRAGATVAGYASYLDRLCSAAAPYQRRLVLDVGILDRFSSHLPAAQAFARAQTADAFDLLSDVVGEEGQLLAVEAPSLRALPPRSEAAGARQLRRRFSTLVALETARADRYQRISLRWYTKQIPITAVLTRSTAAGTAAAAPLAHAVATLQRRLGAQTCDREPPPAG
jgi:hypothetical protein